MALAEFEEKEYESILYTQLLHGSQNVWSPGQVLEATVGFDYAMLTAHVRFWALHGYAAAPLGIVLDAEPMRHWWTHVVRPRPMPDFALNLFIQAKRPSSGRRASKKLTAKGLKNPYWKFTIEGHQQVALESLSRATPRQALVCYAAPAFDRCTALYAHSRGGTIVDASTFPTALSLSNHEAWYYDAPGCKGVANPEVERIEGPSLQERIDAFVANAGTDTNSRNAPGAGIKELSASISEALSSEDVGDTSRTAIYFDRLREIDSYLAFQRPTRNEDFIRAYLAVDVFARTFQLQWYVLGAA
jgi:hypothetical protein